MGVKKPNRVTKNSLNERVLTDIKLNKTASNINVSPKSRVEISPVITPITNSLDKTFGTLYVENIICINTINNSIIMCDELK